MNDHIHPDAWATRQREHLLAATPPCYHAAIEHVASGRRDGNYLTPGEPARMLAYWRKAYPQETFRPCAGTDGALPLRTEHIDQPAVRFADLA